MKNFILFLFFCSPILLIGQVNWTGAAGTNDWNTAMNWDSGVVPGMTDAVNIPSSFDVEFTGTSTVKRVKLNGSAQLHVISGTLTIDGATAEEALEQTGSSAGLINDGTIIIQNTTHEGLLCKGTWMNNGTLTITNTTEHNLRVAGGTFTNTGTVNITLNNASTDEDGLALDDNTTSGGVTTLGTFTNNGMVNITMTAGDDGLHIQDGSSFINNSMLNITATGADMALHIVDQNGTTPSSFVNGVNGVTNISGSIDFSIQVDGDNDAANQAILDNFGSLTVTGGAEDGIRIRRGGIVNNNTDATLAFINTGKDAIQVDGPSFLINDGTISIDGTGTGEEALELNGVGSTFNNLTNGLYMVDNCADDGIEVNNGSVLNNDGAIRIDNSAGEDIETFPGFTFNNTANATFAPGSSPGDLIVKGDLDLGASTTTFEISGLTPTTDFDQILNSVTANTLTISSATAHLEWGAYVPNENDCFKIVDGSGAVGGQFATVTSSNPAINYAVDYPGTEVIICIEAALPVDLVSLTGEKTERGSELKWATASELNNEGFEIERSNNGSDWTKIGYVRGNGTSSELMHYTYTDATPSEGMNYYRLKQNDFDGQFEYSKTVSIEFKTEKDKITFSPNPVNDVLYVNASQELEDVVMQLMDANGKVLWTSKNLVSEIPFEAYSPGLYFLNVVSPSSSTVQKIIKK